MPRTSRKQSESGIFHVMARGIDRQVIFHDDEDCEKYLQCLSACKKDADFTLYAFCLMGNHLHLLVRPQAEPLAALCKRVSVRYVHWYNKKYVRTGHLFQDRFKSEPVEDDSYFLSVLRYIYQNPVKAGLCKTPEEYPWSSCCPSCVYRGLADTQQLYELIPPQELSAFLAQDVPCPCIDIDRDGRLSDREAAQLIRQMCHLTVSTDFGRLDKALWGGYLCELQQKRCSIRQMARLTGLTKAQIERCLLKH